MVQLDRRSFLNGGAAAGAAALMPRATYAAAPGPPIEQLGYGDVTLLPGLARTQFDTTLETLLAFDEGALFRPFREKLKLPAQGGRFGGWYDWSARFDPPGDLTGFIPGHSFGQYVSALARGYAVSGDPRAKAKVHRLVEAFRPTISRDFYEDYPLPAYTYDKTLIGLLDAFAFTGNMEALRLVGPATEAVLPWLPGRALDRQVVERQPHRNVAFGWDETYTLPENLYLAADRGAGDRFRQMARAYLLDDAYFDPLAGGKNVLPGRHAYSHMNALASAMRAWFEDGSQKHLAAARNGMAFIEEQSFATGGWGPNEGFIEPGSAKLGESLEKVHGSFETPCGTYGHFKVARYLIRATGDSRYGDTMERLLYNAALGVLPLKADGTAFYYSDYSDAGSKTYYGAKCPCCSGTLGQLTADYGISAYFRDDLGLYVNLYLPSKAIWRRADEPALTLTQGGGYPLGDNITMFVDAPRPVRMALRLRIPAWAAPGTRILVNGTMAADTTPGRFATIARTWRQGDRIELVLPRPLRTEAVDRHHPSRIAVLQGPLALFATGKSLRSYNREEMAGVRQVPGTARWTLSDGTESFRPFFGIGDDTTRLYQFVS